ncbi:3'-hydroxy-N-methyl-(S)-coclaurine 4'-O-methyltransferase [Coccomyxa sp. Obi]|nr:3'-hydroxy-N-methyl-(S)-coclaurine 4'-O-methyltransferase [Coccomyxa sp. Obi]
MAWQESEFMRDWSNPPPWPIFRFGTWLLSLLKLFVQWIQPPPLTLFDISMGAWQSQVLYTVAALSIADVLGSKGPQTAEELAYSLGVDSGRLYRVLRSAVQMGVFSAIQPKGEDVEVRFKNNRLSACLREDHPNCLRHMMLHFKEHNQPAFDELAWAVRTGGSAWRKTHDGLSQFEWLQQDPKEEHKFSKAMQQIDGLGTHAMASDYGWNQHARIVDIGGAYGSFIGHLLTVHKRPHGVLFDQPQVVDRTKDMWRGKSQLAELVPRMEFVGGDFFNADTLPVAKDGDVWVMRLILHDWNDADSVTILSNVRRAMGGADARLLIVETTLGKEFSDPLFQRALLDVHMMVVHNGAERTVTEWKGLLNAAGFSFGSHIPTRGVFSIVEAFPT